jgi:hypothetical protein
LIRAERCPSEKNLRLVVACFAIQQIKDVSQQTKHCR